MDFLEKAFGKVWKPRRQKWRSLESTVFLDQIKNRLHFLAQYFLPSKNELQIKGSLWQVGFDGEDLLLPDQIGLFADNLWNEYAYMNLTLKACAFHCKGYYSQYKGSSRTALRFESLKKYNEINHFLSNEFSQWTSYESEYVQKLSVVTKECLQDYIHGDLDQKILHSKSNDKVADFLMYLVPTLGRSVTDRKLQPVASSENQAKERKERPRHIHDLKAAQLDELDNSEKQINPVMHSFEKMNTADDYDGRKMFEDDDSDIEDDVKSLDEVELKSQKRLGSNTKSLFQAEYLSASHPQEKWMPAPSACEVLLYDEWNFTKKNYRSKYCQIYIQNFEADSLKQVAATQFVETVRNKFSSRILGWQRVIERIYNEPLWQKNQKDGSEVDIDAALRIYSDLACGVCSVQNVYQNKKKSLSDVVISIVFDQSLSTDSWVADQRVMAVIQESLVVLGLIFNDLDLQFSVAGTYSQTHKKISFIKYKDFRESWDSFLNKVVSIESQGYTRLGPALRHAQSQLQQQKARKKLLLLFTDGKPTDLDVYEGAYGLADIHQAVLEGEKKGITTWALTIDRKAQPHFKKMFHKFSVLQNPNDFADELVSILLQTIR